MLYKKQQVKDWLDNKKFKDVHDGLSTAKLTRI